MQKKQFFSLVSVDEAEPAQHQKAAPEPRNRYHHGSLRTALLTEAIKVIESDGVENISIRQLAKNLGVSAAAPFRHFPDRTALLTAVAEQATEQLGSAVAAALGKARGQSPWEQLLAIGQAYLRWAAENPSHFQVVSDRRLIDYESSAAMRASNEGIRQRMRELLAQTQQKQGVEPDLALLLMRAMVYGLARMQVDGQLAEWSPVPSAEPQRAQNQALQLLIRMLGAYDGGDE